MSNPDLAEQLNADGMRFRDEGHVARAEAAYRAAMDADPTWSAPLYNLGLLFKYECRWAESLEFNRRATQLAPDDEAAWWNLGIAATAMADWPEARRAWEKCGIEVPAGTGAPEFHWGSTPVRLNPNGDAEVVWARRIDPARARILSVPLPTSPFRWNDIVLNDGAVEGERIVDGRRYPVFNVLQRLEQPPYRTFVLELGDLTPEAKAALETCATHNGGAAEDWGTFTNIMCRACSLGLPDEHTHGDGPPAHPHWGLAARDHDQADAILRMWRDTSPGAEVIVWYEASGVA
jgi:tetratricopeptide (TPR) repeat protein